MSDDDERRPWDSPGITGVTPPGRRLDKPGDKRYAKWAASGVRGVVPPGSLKPGEGAAAEWLQRKGKRRPTKPSVPKKTSKPAPTNPERPTAGFLPDVFSDTDDPRSLKVFLDEIAFFMRDNQPDEDAPMHLAELIGQSHAPYEIIVGFTLLSAVVGQDTEMRNRFAWALERGAKAFYNLAMRLDRKVKAPRGLAPQRLDPIFYDLPSTAYQVPYAFATDAFLRVMELVRADTGHDRLLITFARDLYDRYVVQRSFGDKPLSDLFPWEEPHWAPEED